MITVNDLKEQLTNYSEASVNKLDRFSFYKI